MSKSRNLGASRGRFTPTPNNRLVWGFTLIEFIVAMGFSVIVLAVVGVTESQFTQVAGFVNQELSNQQGLDQVMQTFQTEARSMGPSSIGAYSIEVASSSQFVFYSDVDSDGIYERVRYSFTSTTFERGIIEPTGNPLTYATSTETVRTLVTNVVSTSSRFTYYNSTYTGESVNSTSSVEYGPNVLTNPSFESGTSPWTFYTNGMGSFSASSPGFDGAFYGRVALTTIGSNTQLYEAYLTLDPNTNYELTFAAYSSTGHDLSVSLLKHTSPYTNYGLSNYVAGIGTGWQTFTVNFMTSGFSSRVTDARLMFWFPGFAVNGDAYAIDNVKLRKILPVPVNVIENSGFEPLASPWTFYTNGSGAFTTTTPGYEGVQSGRLSLTTVGSNTQLYQANVDLESETKYRLSFAAYSSTGHNVGISVLKHTSPYTNYGLNNFAVDLTTGWQLYTTDFTTAGFYGPVTDGRLMFALNGYASNGDSYYIDDVQMKRVASSSPSFAVPSVRMVRLDLYTDLTPSLAPQPSYFTSMVSFRNLHHE
ncbi:MAG: carbohydrate binding domain-containing protein [bacterium]|nr:carbohydrate binding domain-containing protein [bacterium]